MTHQRHRFTHHRGSHHGGLGMALAKLALTLIGGMARNKMAEKAHQRQIQNAKKHR